MQLSYYVALVIKPDINVMSLTANDFLIEGFIKYTIGQLW